MSTARRKLELADLLPSLREEWSLADLTAILRRRRAYLIGAIAAMFLLTTCYCLLATPRFQSTGEIEVKKQSPASFGLENGVTGDAATAGIDSLDYSMTLETEAQILQSPTLALSVIRESEARSNT